MRRALIAQTLALTLAAWSAIAAPVLGAETTTSGAVSLVADRVQVQGPDRILAEGNVVILYGDVRLKATRVLYDRASDSLEIEGPLTLSQGEAILILADAATLSTDLREGLMQSARVVLDQQLQIAAVEVHRTQGRYMRMDKVVASSCEVCIERPVPLWEIRSSQVVHDQLERQLYFHNAQFRVMGLPILWLPRLRLPDPTLDRATGFLPPRASTSTLLGKGLRLPYFIRMGDHADLTLTPLLTSATTTLEARYRQAFRTGDISFEGAVSSDDLLPGTTRYFLFGEGQFALKRDFKLEFGIELVSDEAYLSDYSYSDDDRLESFVALSRARRDEYIFAGLTQYDTLRADEIPNSTKLPFGQIDLLYEHRFQNGPLGGSGSWQISALGLWRESDMDQMGLQYGGRDMTRVGAQADWGRDWVLADGLVAELQGSLSADAYWIGQDSTFDSTLTHVTPTAAVSLRYPMSRNTAGGAIDVIEPQVHLAWTDRIGADVPNEDSVMVEFDEANLFALNRFPGHDRYERGLRASIGATWTRYDPTGWTYTLAAGRVFYDKDLGQFSDTSGLSGTSSDWLIAGQVQLDTRFALQGRTLFNDALSLSKSEILAMWQSDRLALATGHVWVEADAAENRADAIHEWALDADWQINDNWRANFDWRYDLQLDDITKAGLGLEYSNECVTVDLSLSRRFTSSTSVTPTTNIGVGVSLNGFGGGRGTKARQCGG